MDKLLSRILLILMPLYFTQGWLFDHSSFISRGILLIWLLIDIYYLAIYFRFPFDSTANLFFLFWIMTVSYWIVSPKTVFVDFVEPTKTYGDLKNITVVFLSIFPFLIWNKNNIVTLRYYQWLGLFFMLSFIVAFNVRNTENLSMSSLENITNNAAYYFPVLLPLLGVFIGKKVFPIFLFSCLYFVLIGAKRGAIVCFFVEVVLFVLLYVNNAPKRSKNKKLGRLLVILLFLSVFVFVVYYFYTNNDFLQQRVENTRAGDSSSRNFIYTKIIEAWLSGDLFSFLFGYGFDYSVTLTGGFAHQDWIELLINHGLLGVIFYLIIFIKLYAYYFKNRHLMDMSIRFVYLASISCWLIRSMFSMGYPSIETSIFGIAIAVAHQTVNNNNNIYAVN